MENEKELLALIDDLASFEKERGLGNRFNIFRAIGIVRQKIRHSRFLAFLLDPSETHGLNEGFLRGFLMAAVTAHPNSHISRLKIAIADLSDSIVRCEREHFDISIRIPELRLFIIIENKVASQERVNQLNDYRNAAALRYSEYQFVGIFLTPDGYEGADENWDCVSYQTVRNELKRAAAETAIQGPALTTIEHYIDLIEREIIVSEELQDACRKIYARHRMAFDLIVQHGQRRLQMHSRFSGPTIPIWRQSSRGLPRFTLLPNRGWGSRAFK